MRYLLTKKPVKSVRTLKQANEDGKEVEITHDLKAQLEIGQFDTIEEAIAEAGGPEKFLDWVNSKKESDAKIPARNVGPSASQSATDDELVEKMKEVAKNHTIGISRGTSVKAKAEAFDEIANLVKSNENVSREQLMELLASLR